MDDLRRLLDNRQPDLESAVAKARQELQTCRARCLELEALIARGEAAVGSPVAPLVSSLREAIEVVLEGRDVMRAPEIATEINERGMYHRPNGAPVDPGQVHNRVHHHPELFERTKDGIRLRRQSRP
jgi:hypothetical protein